MSKGNRLRKMRKVTPDFLPDTPMEMGLEINGKNQWIHDGVDHRVNMSEIFNDSYQRTHDFEEYWKTYIFVQQKLTNESKKEIVERVIKKLNLNDDVTELANTHMELIKRCRDENEYFDEKLVLTNLLHYQN